MSEVTIGGARLGSENKMKVNMKNFSRSSHDLGYLWKSTVSAGTLVPFMTEVALPGDSFDIDLDCDILTHPTIGALFGSYKVQLDVFQIPIRLYNAKLHMNMLGIGMDMSKVGLPQLNFTGKQIDADNLANHDVDNLHSNPSSLLSYLGMRGAGDSQTEPQAQRYFNAVPYLGYFDIYKNYFANKQEEIGVMIHNEIYETSHAITFSHFLTSPGDASPELITIDPGIEVVMNSNSIVRIEMLADDTIEHERYYIEVSDIAIPAHFEEVKLIDVFYNSWQQGKFVYFENAVPEYRGWNITLKNVSYDNLPNAGVDDKEPTLREFPLENIDKMRQELLTHFEDTSYVVDANTISPYGLPLRNFEGRMSSTLTQEGLCCKTYNSDLFNNWISTEWIDGVDGISAITAVSTVGDSFTIDELNLAKKVYDMLNRITLSGGSYDDWLDAVYTHDRTRSAENPIYLGGQIKSLIFQEVVSSNSGVDPEGEYQPQGNLAGRGRIGGNAKGGKIVAKIDEPSYIMGLFSLTPRIDFSQGNKWDTNLKTMNDLHKPSLDAIGFQDLITDQMAWFDSTCTNEHEVGFKSAGKQPAWINYMTNVNVIKGNFAVQSEQMFMTLNRRYDVSGDYQDNVFIKDLTTYIDPAKFNYIFAETRRDAQNFWVQIAVNITARRKMSAKVIPNL